MACRRGIMALQQITIHRFRNIGTADLTFSSSLNLITGPNAAGKTSLLEAIHFLGRARSFRTPHAEQLIANGWSEFQLVGRISTGNGARVPIGMKKSNSGLIVRLESRSITRLSELAIWFPIQALSGGTHSLLEGGPRERRQFLDWGLFHVEPAYRIVWQRYSRVLKQRNAALRGGRKVSEVSVWEGEFLDSANVMDGMRRRHLGDLEGPIREEIEGLLGTAVVELSYQPGWPRDQTLEAALLHGLERDREQGFTRYGPHRGDFSVRIDGRTVQEQFSRGQCKSVIAALLLAQTVVLHRRSRRGGIFLVDDLPSELDAAHQDRMMTRLQSLGTQIFVTAIDASSLDLTKWQAYRQFHVEHGTFQKVV
jgi:DNA replication and repair protein RecF